MININNLKKVIKGAKRLSVLIEDGKMQITDSYFLISLPVHVEVLGSLAEKFSKKDSDKDIVEKLFGDSCCIHLEGKELKEDNIEEKRKLYASISENSTGSKVVDTRLFEYLDGKLARIIKVDGKYEAFNEHYTRIINWECEDLEMSSPLSRSVKVYNDNTDVIIMGLPYKDNVNENLKEEEVI